LQAVSLLPPEVVVEQVDLVRVEKSLHSLGFFASTANRGNSRTIMQIIRRPTGQRIHAKAVIEGIPSLGLPTTADRDKYMALMKIALSQRDAEGQLINPVRFTGADMIKLLRLQKGGFHYDEINDWCKRMVATTIMSEASIFLADRKQYATDTFHVFDRVVLIGEHLNDGSRSELYQVYLSHWQLTNLNRGYMLPLDFNAYLRLRRDIAKALFGHLSVWFYASQGQYVEKNYTDLCQILNIRAYPHLSKAKAVLQPSMEELMDIGYLASWDIERTNRSSSFKLALTPGKRLLSLPNFAAVTNTDAQNALESQLPGWVATLVQRGVTERKARQMALDIGDDQPVADQIEYAEHLIEQDRRGRAKIVNAAGFLVWAVESNLAVPENFETSRKRQLLAVQEHARNDVINTQLRLQLEYEEFCQQEVDRKLAADYNEERLLGAIQQQLKAIRQEQPEWFLQVPDATRRQVALGRLKSSILQNLALPGFERWSRKKVQQHLF
jgi:hypothetical protein